MSAPQPLLAKRPRERGSPRPEETLVGHSAKALECFQRMFGPSPDEPSHFGARWLRFFGLPPEASAEFHTSGALASISHDVGKATSGFQEMVTRGGDQLLWHDHLGFLLLSRDPVRRWLQSASPASFDAVAVAVLCHHLRAEGDGFPELRSPNQTLTEVHWGGVGEVLSLASEALGLAPPPDLSSEPALWTLGGRTGFDFGPLAEELRRGLKRTWRRMNDDERLRRLVWAVRAAVIAVDSAASGLVREGQDVATWVSAAFDGGGVLDGASIDEKVIEPRIKEIEAQKGSFAWTDFQVAAKDLGDRALLLAPCGSGKTLAAWRWIKARLDRAPRARAVFLYPTRATATEGFRDYVSWAPEADAALLTGTAAYELNGMFSNPEDERFGRDYRAQERLFVLGYWHRRIFSATVDQFLGFLQHVYGSTCLLPVLADSVVVIDEVHSFDRNLFTALKGFLRSFDVPVLCMTASLPANRRRELTEDCGLQVFPADDASFPDLAAKTWMPRYRVRRIARDDADGLVAGVLDGGGRVLWVVNTVARCQGLARQWASRGALCYHSRFKLEDRKQRHSEVVAAFQQKAKPALAVTTQVCEMSLDLDADVLITEAAPVTSLIQRMGRCNRQAKPGSGAVGEVCVYAPEEEKPYGPEDLAGVEGFLAALDGREASQERLQELLEWFGPAGFEPDRYTGFLESGPWAKSREESLRAIEEFCVPGILDTTEDREAFFRLRRDRKAVDGLVVPVPRKLAKEDRRLGGFLRSAPGSHYDSRFGLMDQPLECTI